MKSHKLNISVEAIVLSDIDENYIKEVFLAYLEDIIWDVLGFDNDYHIEKVTTKYEIS